MASIYETLPELTTLARIYRWRRDRHMVLDRKPEKDPSPIMSSTEQRHQLLVAIPKICGMRHSSAQICFDNSTSIPFAMSTSFYSRASLSDVSHHSLLNITSKSLLHSLHLFEYSKALRQLLSFVSRTAIAYHVGDKLMAIHLPGRLFLSRECPGSNTHRGSPAGWPCLSHASRDHSVCHSSLR